MKFDQYAARTNSRQPPTSFVLESDGVLSIETAWRVAGSPLDSTVSQTAKRAVDMALALAAGVLLLPLLVAIAVAIKCASRGPIFYRQLRVGRAGRPFRIWKFRTMVADAEQRLDEYLQANPMLREQWITEYKLKEDPRIIPWTGRLLRKSSLDELPQLWNVLCGDMSLVGPRPLPPYHLEQFEKEFRHLRGAMRPGITGQWQVCSRNCSAPEMFLKWDTFYVRNWSVWLDLQILCRTPWVVLFANGSRRQRNRQPHEISARKLTTNVLDA